MQVGGAGLLSKPCIGHGQCSNNPLRHNDNGNAKDMIMILIIVMIIKHGKRDTMSIIII